MIVAIDGPAGSGKSTTAKAVARRLNFVYLDTGSMYRVVALAFIRAGVSGDEADRVERVLSQLQVDIDLKPTGNRILLNGEDVTDCIRTPEVTEMASRVSTLAPVREKLVALQRRIAGLQAGRGSGVVVDGRDIGTVVFPKAEVKVFMTADPAMRARRRFEELTANGEQVAYQEVLEEILERDRRDTTRALSPLRRADDAQEMDTSALSIEEQVDAVVDLVHRHSNSVA